MGFVSEPVITADMLIADDALIGALEVTDITAEAITGTHYRTATAGRRLEVGTNLGGGADPSNLAFFNGTEGAAGGNGVIGPYTAGSQPALAITSPTSDANPGGVQVDLISGVADAASGFPQLVVNAGSGGPVASFNGGSAAAGDRGLSISGQFVATGDVTAYGDLHAQGLTLTSGGWISLPLASGVTGAVYLTARAGMAYIELSHAGYPATANAVTRTLVNSGGIPAAFRPYSTMYGQWTIGTIIGRVDVSASGFVTVTPLTAGSGTVTGNAGGICYPIG